MKNAANHAQDTFVKEPRLHVPRWYWMLPIILVAITIFLYYPSLSYAFEFDDLANIEKLFAVRHTTFKSIFMQNSRWISYWLNALYYSWLPQSAKFDPFIYRLGNVVFHCLTGVLVFFMIKLASVHATKQRFFHYYGSLIAFMTAGLFLLHPVQTQTVSYVIQGQLEGLAGFFTMAIITTFLGLSLVQRPGIRHALTALLVVLAFIACGSKEIIIVCPVLVMLVDWFFVAQGNWHSVRQRRGIHLLLFLIIVSLYIYFLKPQFFLNVFGFNSALPNNIGNVLTEHKYQAITPYYFCISQFKVILHYVWIFIWPFTMSVDYDWKLSRHFLALDCLIPFIALLLFAWYIVRRLYRNKIDIVSFGFLWFFVAILPRSSIVPSTELLADYKTYIASVGLFFVAALGFVHLMIWVRQRYVTRVSGAVFAMMAILASGIALGLVAGGAYIRNKVWSSPAAFWNDIIKHAPKKARAYNNLGVYYCEGQDHPRAIELFKKAIALDNYYADPLNNIAVSYAQTGQIDLAIDALKQSCRLMPYHPEIYNNLANMYMQKNDHEKVVELLHTSLKIRPHYGKAYYNLGNYYVKINNLEKAFEAFRDGCTKADFDNVHGFSAYGKISMALKKYDDALIAYKKLLAVDPKSLEARFNLATIYFLTQQYPQAEAEYKELLQFDPKNVGIVYQLAETLRAQGKYQEALPQYRMVQQLQPLYAPLYHALADTLAKLGNRSEAITLLRQFIAQNPPVEARQQAEKLLAEIQ